MTLKGKWRIVEMALWDLDFLDMMEPAYIFSTTKPGASSPSAASPAKSTAARPRLHLYRPTLADFFNSLLAPDATGAGASRGKFIHDAIPRGQPRRLPAGGNG